MSTEKDAMTKEARRIACERALAAALAAEDAPPVEPSAELRGRVLASVTSEGRFAGVSERLGAVADLSGERLREILEAARDPHGPGWTDGPAPGIRWYFFRPGPARAAAAAALISCEPGVTFPEHRHRGPETALILDGAAIDSSGDRWAIGDRIEFEGGTSHSFLTAEAPLLAAVVAEGGHRLRGASPGRGALSATGT